MGPGGDSLQRVPPLNPNGGTLSTYPAEAMAGCLRPLQGPDPGQPVANYCYLQGTSVASPHVAGVAALIISRFGDLQNPQNGKMRPTRAEQYVQQTADPIACPDDLTFYEPFPRPAPAGVDGEPQACKGGTSSNSWYGNGHVDALDAVTHDTQNDPQPSPPPLP